MAETHRLSTAMSSASSSRASRATSRRRGITRRRPRAASVAWNTIPRTRPLSTSPQSAQPKTSANAALRTSRAADLVEPSVPVSEILRLRHCATTHVKRGATLAGSPPCFNHARCQNRAVTEKSGRSLCRNCADSVKGQEYPLRQPSSAAIYASGFDCAQATDMLETKFASAELASFKEDDLEEDHTNRKGGETDASSSQHL